MNARVKALNNLYRRGKITQDGLKQAVIDNVITKEQYQEITGEIYK